MIITATGKAMIEAAALNKPNLIVFFINKIPPVFPHLGLSRFLTTIHHKPDLK